MCRVRDWAASHCSERAKRRSFGPCWRPCGLSVSAPQRRHTSRGPPIQDGSPQWQGARLRHVARTPFRVCRLEILVVLAVASVPVGASPSGDDQRNGGLDRRLGLDLLLGVKGGDSFGHLGLDRTLALVASSAYAANALWSFHWPCSPFPAVFDPPRATRHTPGVPGSGATGVSLPSLKQANT